MPDRLADNDVPINDSGTFIDRALENLREFLADDGRQAKELGFRLMGTKELLALWFDPRTKCCDVRKKPGHIWLCTATSYSSENSML